MSSSRLNWLYLGYALFLLAMVLAPFFLEISTLNWVVGSGVAFHLGCTLAIYFGCRLSVPKLHCPFSHHIPGFHWPLVWLSLVQIIVIAILLLTWYRNQPDLWQANAHVPAQVGTGEFIAFIIGQPPIEVQTLLGKCLFLGPAWICIVVVTYLLFKQPIREISHLLLTWVVVEFFYKSPRQVLTRLHYIGPRAAYWAGGYLLRCVPHHNHPASLERISALIRFLGESGNPNSAWFLLKKLPGLEGFWVLQGEIIDALQQLAETCPPGLNPQLSSPGNAIGDPQLAALVCELFAHTQRAAAREAQGEVWWRSASRSFGKLCYDCGQKLGAIYQESANSSKSRSWYGTGGWLVVKMVSLFHLKIGTLLYTASPALDAMKQNKLVLLRALAIVTPRAADLIAPIRQQLVELSVNEDGETYCGILTVLFEIDSGCQDFLIEAVDHPSPIIRRDAAILLA